MKEFFKGVVWPRQTDKCEPLTGPDGPIYRYAIVGMLVTEEPIDAWDENTVVLCGPAFGVADMLSMLHKGWAPPHVANSDATGVMLSLKEIKSKRPNDEEDEVDE